MGFTTNQDTEHKELFREKKSRIAQKGSTKMETANDEQPLMEGTLNFQINHGSYFLSCMKNQESFQQNNCSLRKPVLVTRRFG